jgi:hypothetical protein
MKKFIVIIAARAVLATAVLAQSIISGGPRPDLRKDKPPVTLSEAYTLALHKLGTETNQFHCVEASSRTSNSKGFRGWVFTFWSTNDVHFEVFVSYGREVWPQRRSQ